jgi:pimeloyl-ACP methyl ester carboxylesterase
MNARAQDHQLCCQHGWPGDHTDWDELAPRLRDAADVLAADLRGFGQSDKYEADPEEIYSAHGQARAVAAVRRKAASRTRWWQVMM